MPKIWEFCKILNVILTYINQLRFLHYDTIIYKSYYKNFFIEYKNLQYEVSIKLAYWI
jgi:hypothetical protein